MSALEDTLRSMIAQEGPISLERYMGLALAHPTGGYYMTRDPLGAGGDFVEVDETYIGHQKGKVSKGSGAGHKIKVLALVDRASGKVRSFADPDLNAKDIHPILRANIAH